MALNGKNRPFSPEHAREKAGSLRRVAGSKQKDLRSLEEELRRGTSLPNALSKNERYLLLGEIDAADRAAFHANEKADAQDEKFEKRLARLVASVEAREKLLGKKLHGIACVKCMEKKLGPFEHAVAAARTLLTKRALSALAADKERLAQMGYKCSGCKLNLTQLKKPK